MKIALPTAIAVMMTGSACGGGGGGNGSALYRADVDRFAADTTRLEALDYTDLERAGLSGSYLYSGRTSFVVIPDATTMTETDLADWTATLDEEDFTATPAVIATMDLTANFTRGTVGGRLHDFRRPGNDTVPGTITLRDGEITDEYYHYNAGLEGRFGERNQPVEGIVFGDFMGPRAQMTLGFAGFTVDDEVMVGIFAGAR